MNFQVTLRLALSETRRSGGRLLFCVLSIAMGVFALTAVRSITTSVTTSFAGQARNTLGADLVLSARQPLERTTAEEVLAKLQARGARATPGVRFYSMLMLGETEAGGADVPRKSADRQSTVQQATKSSTLVRVHAVGDGYPFYGSVLTVPEQQFARLGHAPLVIADPRVVSQLGMVPGQAVRLGDWQATFVASLNSQPGSATAQFSLAPAVYIHERYLAETGLLQTGSRVDYEYFVKLPETLSAKQVKSEFAAALGADRVRVRTPDEAAGNVRRFLERMSRFLTVVGLVTLLLGALGIASALRSFMHDKLDHAAILRCLGVTPMGVFKVYAVLALVVASFGSLMGALLGMLAPWALGPVVSALGQGLLPVDLGLAPSFGAAAHGLGAGIVATLAFTLVPVLRTASVAPMRVLRRDVSTSVTHNARLVLMLGFVAALATVLALSVMQSDSWRVGLVFTGAVVASALVLWALATVLARSARLLAQRIGPYSVRQGVANLYRPGNQTVSVMIAVGLGVMLLCTLLVLERSLQEAIAVDRRGELPNLFVIDIQPEQAAGVTQLVAAAGVERPELQPMIAARIKAVNGAAVTRDARPGESSQTGEDVDSSEEERTWESRLRTREYFVSYRSALLDSEVVTTGQFWMGRPAQQEASIDEQLAESLSIELGDTLTLDIQGLPFDSVVTSFREIRWQAMRPNAMIVLSPGDIERAPKTYVAAFRLKGQQQRYALSDRLATSYPNLSVVDVTDAVRTVMLIVDRVSLVFRGMGGLALVTGAVILAGAVASGRHIRQREAMLLKVLGAKRSTLRSILIVEYLTLASLGAGCGWLLAELLNRGVFAGLFEVPIVVPYAAVLSLVVGTVAANVLLGAIVGRTVSNAHPLELLREES